MVKKTVVLILIIIMLASAVFVKLAFSKDWFVSYLSVNSPVSPDLLIVEGWVSKSTIRQASFEFKNMNYSRILTSGSPTDPFYLLSEDGYLEFDFKKNTIGLHQRDTISFILKGTPVLGLYPEYLISINDHQVSTGFTSYKPEPYSYILDSSIVVEKISISFINDTHHMGEDRNMKVESLYINRTKYLARSSQVLHYDTKDHQRLNPYITNFSSVAEICANKLQKEGIPGHVIEVIPSPVSQKNRTLSSAIVLSDYLENQNKKIAGVNILSEGIHARRTWISYKFALRNQTKEIGIICVPFNQNSVSTEHTYTNKEIVRELTSIIYYAAFFNKKRYRKQFIQHYSSN